jgi:ATP-binding cassette subfamily B protein IrtA
MHRHKNRQKGLWAITDPVKGYIITAIGMAVIGSISSVMIFILLAATGGSLGRYSMSFSFKQSFLILIFVVILNFLINYYSFVISHLGAFKLEEILRTRITTRLAKIPLGYIIANGTGALKKVLLDDVKNLHAFVADSTPMVGKSLAAPVASFIALLIIDYRLALVALSVLVLGAGIMYFVMKDDADYREKYDKNQSEVNRAVIEFVQAMPVVRTFDDGTTSFKRYYTALERFRTFGKAWIAATGTAGQISLTILNPLPTLVAVTTAGLFFIKQGSLGFVPFIAALMVSTGMADALMPLMWMRDFLKKSKAAAMRIHEIMDLPELTIPSSFQRPEKFDIAFENVSFKYNARDNYALKNVSFSVSQNTATALVGPSGAGKSTVAKLIPRFWDITQGSIKIGGIDIRNIETKTLMDTVTFVFQDTFLFNDTLAKNIKIANENATDEDMMEAARAARIHDFIMTLPKGYETPAGDRGVNLSGGQKQRITIARAILRNTPIIVLDEATAFADPENEEEIVKALSSLLKSKTVIVIAHRLSTIKDVEQIVVFDQGEITETGNHDDLMGKQGTYERLWCNYEKARTWDLHQEGHKP